MAIPDHPFGIFNKIVAYFDPGVIGFLIQPQDGEGAETVVRDEQVIVAARNVNGPYDTNIVELNNHREDWRGNLPTDVLTFLGGSSRSGGQLFRGGGPEIRKQGIPYARIPTQFGVVSTAFFSEKFDGTRTLVVIAAATIGLGGPTGIGDSTWTVLMKPEGRDPGDESLFDPVDNPSGWKVIDTFRNENDDTNGRRFQFMGVWRANRAGTEASCMVPINTVGDVLPHDMFDSPFVLCSPEPPGFSCQSRHSIGDGGNFTGLGAYRFRLMKIEVNPNSETATFTDEGEITEYNTTTTGVTSFSCTEAIFGSQSGGVSSTFIVDAGDGTMIPSAVDYDFETDNRVFAYIRISGGFQVTQSNTLSQTFDFNGSVSESDNNTWEILTPLTSAKIRQFNYSLTATVSGNSSFSNIAGSLSLSGSGFGFGTTNFQPRQRVSYLDLRHDILVIGTGDEPSPARSYSSSSPVLTLLGGCGINVSYVGGGGQSNLIQYRTELWIKGVKVASYAEEDPRPSSQDPPPSEGASFGRPQSGAGCCGAPGPVTMSKQTASFEMFVSTIDDPTGTGFGNTLSVLAGVDQFENAAVSYATYKGRKVNTGTPPGDSPGGDGAINFLSGDDLISVLNDVEYAAGPLTGDAARAFNLEVL